MLLADSPIESALADLNPHSAKKLRSALQDPAFSGILSEIAPHEILGLLPLAAGFSIHPVSGIGVGAAALGASGQIYLGANLEFQGLALHASLHAEQSAVINAWMHEESELVALYISEIPCGHCRQFLRELSNADRLKIHVAGQTYGLNSLLPHAFGPRHTKGNGLLDSRPVALESARPNPDTAMQRAINAAQRSYTPYSRSPEGFVLECLDGHFFSGRAAESVAFNPSVPGVLVALNQRNLSASRAVTLTTAKQAKLATTINNPLPFARALISSVSKAEIQVVQMEAMQGHHL